MKISCRTRPVITSLRSDQRVIGIQHWLRVVEYNRLEIENQLSGWHRLIMTDLLSLQDVWMFWTDFWSWFPGQTKGVCCVGLTKQHFVFLMVVLYLDYELQCLQHMQKAELKGWADLVSAQAGSAGPARLFWLVFLDIDLLFARVQKPFDRMIGRSESNGCLGLDVGPK